jgi:hypothetical protein
MIDVKCGANDAITTVATSRIIIGKIVKTAYECLMTMEINSFLKLASNLGSFVKLN